MNSVQSGFLVDPALLPDIMRFIADFHQSSEEMNILSSREREIVVLLRDGLNRRSIAEQLHISEATLKTHIKNIARKRETLQWSQRGSSQV